MTGGERLPRRHGRHGAGGGRGGHGTGGPGGPDEAGRVPGGRNRRFPGFAVEPQARHWDRETAEVVLGRAEPRPAGGPRFFSAAEAETAGALLDQLLAQWDEPRVPVLAMVDARLLAGETDGWRYADMPEDGDAWRRSLAGLDADARASRGRAPFARLDRRAQAAIVQSVHDLGPAAWHGMPAGHVWSLWTRYACAAFYAHPWVWNEMGFPGPAYPRGYVRLGVGAREWWEVADADPRDPVAQGPFPDGHGTGAPTAARPAAGESAGDSGGDSAKPPGEAR